MAKAKDERIELLKKFEKAKMVNKSAGLEFRDDEFIFVDASPQSAIWNVLRGLLDELAEFRAEAWIANHFKEKSK